MKKNLVRKVQTRFTLQVSNTNSREPPSSIRTSASVLSAEEVPFAHQCQCKYVNVFPRIRLAVRNSRGWLVCARQVRPITFQVVPRISKRVPRTISRQTHNANRRETFHLERHDIPSLPPPASTSHTINLPACTASDQPSWNVVFSFLNRHINSLVEQPAVSFSIQMHPVQAHGMSMARLYEAV